jgi:hypothetical protein
MFVAAGAAVARAGAAAIPALAGAGVVATTLGATAGPALPDPVAGLGFSDGAGAVVQPPMPPDTLPEDDPPDDDPPPPAIVSAATIPAPRSPVKLAETTAVST